MREGEAPTELWRPRHIHEGDIIRKGVSPCIKGLKNRTERLYIKADTENIKRRKRKREREGRDSVWDMTQGKRNKATLCSLV